MAVPIKVKIQSLLKRFAPFVIEWGRGLKKFFKRKELERKKKQGQVIRKEDLLSDLQKMGIVEGDAILVHSALSKMGFVEGGAATVVDALLKAVGPTGNVLMPSFAHQTFSKYYLQSVPVFDVRNSPSRAGAITEVFRKYPGVKRSLHPTDSVCAFGPLADYFTSTHFGQLTPYNEFSPYYKFATKGGKILNIGVPLNTSCTNLHTLEDAVPDFRFPVYDKEEFDAVLIDEDGKKRTMRTKVHDPSLSEKRKPDTLVPLFEKEGVLTHHRFGEAEVLLVDAAKLFECMLRNYKEHGVSMYTPLGNKN